MPSAKQQSYAASSAATPAQSSTPTMKMLCNRPSIGLWRGRQNRAASSHIHSRAGALPARDERMLHLREQDMRSESASRQPAKLPVSSCLQRILEIAQTCSRRINQHSHVAGLVLVLPHHLMGERDVVPGENFAHARVDAAVEHKLIGGARLLEMGEMGTLDALLAHPHIARVEGEVVAGGPGAEHHHAAALDHKA